MLTTFLAWLGISGIWAAIVAFVIQHATATIVGLTTGGITTLVTIFYLWYTVRRLRRAFLIAVTTLDMERRVHLKVINQIQSSLENAKTNRHRMGLITNLEKYATEFAKEVRRVKPVPTNTNHDKRK